MQNNINQINTSISFNAAMFFAVGLTLYIQLGQKDMMINGKYSRFTREKLYRLSVLASGIFLIAVIYFEILSIETFENNKTKENANYLNAATLSLFAQSIRYNTLVNTNQNQEINPEDILP